MARSSFKGKFSDRRIARTRKVHTPLTIWSRRSVILAKDLTKACLVHNGRQFKRVQITPALIGKKYGTVMPTRRKMK